MSIIIIFSRIISIISNSSIIILECFHISNN